MRYRLVLRLLPLLVLLPLCGCRSNNRGKIEGTKWRSQAGPVRGQNLPAGALRLEFGVDGKLVYGGFGKTFTGTYSFGMGDYVTLNLDQELAGSRTHSEKITINGNQ